MRGIYNSVTDIRRKVFTEIARLAYEGGDYAKKIEELPYKILPGHKASYRNSIFLERAIIGERLRLGNRTSFACSGRAVRTVRMASKKVQSRKSTMMIR